MAFPGHADFLIIGAGIHGLSTAWRLAERLRSAGEKVEGRIIVLDKSGIASGASGIEPPPLKWSAPIVRKAEDQRWPLRDRSPKRLS